MSLLKAVLALEPISVTASAPPGSDLMQKILGWLLWGGFWACVAGTIIAGAMFALQATSKHESGGKAGLALAMCLIGAIVCGSATQLIGGVSG